MKASRCILFGIASGLAASAWAQTPPKPLNLELPPESIPAAGASTAPARASSVAPASARSAESAARSTAAGPDPSAPGMYYGDTSGRPAHPDVAGVPACDDSTYNTTQVHGSVGMGVVAGSHVSGNYQTGTINFTKATGSCEHPTGGISISIGVGQGDVHGHGWRH